MNKQEHLELLEKKMKQNLEIAKAKNSDYCGPGEDNDPFKNFRECERAGVPTEKGLLVRMYDKMSRISSLMSQDTKVKSETIQDALLDLSNYALILSNYLDSIHTTVGQRKEAKALETIAATQSFNKKMCEIGACIHPSCQEERSKKDKFLTIGDQVKYIGPLICFKGIIFTIADSSDSSEQFVVSDPKGQYHLFNWKDVCPA